MSRFNFTFFPRRLADERLELEKKFDDLEEKFFESKRAVLYPRLLKEIKLLADDGPSLVEYADKLTPLQLKVLSLIMSDTLDDMILLNRIYQILAFRVNDYITRNAWIAFQSDYGNFRLVALLREAVMSGVERVAGISSFLQTEDFVQSLIHHVVQCKTIFKETLTDLKIQDNTALATHLRFEMLREGLIRDEFIRREGVQTIKTWVEYYTLEQYKTLLGQYLSARNHDKYQKVLMLQARERLKDPRKEPDNWRFLDQAALKNTLQWFKLEELKEFFEKDSDNRRFQFWKGYANEMLDVEAHLKKHVVVMDFGSFVVVEFVEVMGAAYFYYKEGFERFFAGQRFRKPEDFKLKSPYVENIKLYITSLSHHGKWEYKFSSFLHNVTNGKF